MTSKILNQVFVEIAEHFLEEHPFLNTSHRVEELAALIELYIADYIAAEQANYELNKMEQSRP